MGGVDLLIWWQKVIQTGVILLKYRRQRMAINTYIIYSQNTSNDKKLSWLAFRQLIIDYWRPCRDYLLNRRESAEQNVCHFRNKIGLRKLSGRREKDCEVCSNKYGMGGRKRTKTVCNRCWKGVYKDCHDNHFCSED